MKKIMKTMTMICLCVIMMCSGAISVFAADTPTFVVEQITGNTGDVVTVNVNVKNNPGIAAASVTVTYDDAVLELQSVNNGTVMEGALYQPPQYMKSPFTMSWVVLENKASDGILASLTFKIKDDATLGNSAIQLSYSSNNVINLDEEEVYFDVQNGGISVECNHVAGNWEIQTPATCTETGTEVQKCTKCGTVLNTRDVQATGHSFGAWETIVSPTCTETGKEQHTCSVCQFTEERDIAATGHVWEKDYTVDKEPTCTEDGSKSIHCKNCDAIKDIQIIPKAHKYSEWVIEQEATCKEDGMRYRVCTVCGEKETEVIPAAHKFGEWITTTAPTCTEDGSEQRTCTVCQFVEIRTVKATGHDWEKDFTVDKEPTETETGLKSIHCKNCDEVKDITEIPVLNASGEKNPVNPTSPENGVNTPATSTDNKAPETGDSSLVLPLFITFISACAVITLLIIYRKKANSTR